MRINNILSFAILALVITSMIACTETYPGKELDMSGDEVLKDWGMEDSIAVKEEYKVISVAISDPSYHTVSASGQSATRGLGAFDYQRDDSLRKVMSYNSYFYIYAFNRDETTSYNASQSCLIKNEPARAIDPASYFLTFENGKQYWNTETPMLPYDFWAYYVDNAVEGTPDPQPDNEGNLGFDITIDGSQDLLCGKAVLTKAQNDTLINNIEQEKLRNSLYSYYTTAHDIFPVVGLKHCLTSLKFQVYPGDETADGIVIDSICVEAPYKGRMTVVAKDAGKLGCTFDKDSIAWLSLHDVNNEYSLQAENNYICRWKEEYGSGDSIVVNVFDREAINVGESLMIPPLAGSDTLNVKITAHREDGKEALPQGYITFVSRSSGFKAGYQYNVRLALYGQQPVGVTAVLTGWALGGSVPLIDPSDEGFKTGAEEDDEE